jgi:hypothetical protein
VVEHLLNVGVALGSIFITHQPLTELGTLLPGVFHLRAHLTLLSPEEKLVLR